MQAQRKLTGILVIALMSAAGIVLGLTNLLTARAGTDDYPSNLKSPQQDTVVDQWGFYNRECTSFAAFRTANHVNSNFNNTMRGPNGKSGRFGNANNWAANAEKIGFQVSQTPSPQWVAQAPQYQGRPQVGGAGHVAWEEVVGSPSTVEDYNWGYPNHPGTYNEHHWTAPNYLNFGAPFNPTPTPTPPPPTPTPTTSPSSSTVPSPTSGNVVALTPSRICDTRTGSGLPCAGQKIANGGTLDVTVAGVGGVPGDAQAAVLNATVANETGGGYLTVYPKGQSRPVSSNINWPGTQYLANLVEVPLGTQGQVSFYAAGSATDLVVDVQGFIPRSSTSVGLVNPINPAARICDTRPGTGTPCSGQTIGPNSTLNVQVSGQGDVPLAGVSAVAVNVTATDTTALSNLIVYPTGQNRPATSNVNWMGASATIANRVLAAVGSGGQISIYNASGSVDVVVDVSAWFTDGADPAMIGSTWTAVSANRICDTRAGSGTSCAGQTLAPNATLTVQVAGAGNIPAMNAPIPPDAVQLNVIAVGPTSGGSLTVYPDGSAAPATSDLNFNTNQTISDYDLALALTEQGSGRVAITNHSAGSTNIILDATGYYASERQAGPIVPLSAARICDTRAGSGFACAGHSIANGGTLTIPVAGQGGIPTGIPNPADQKRPQSPNAVAAVLNLTTTNQPGPGALIAYATGQPRPATSNLNWATGQDIANLAIVPIGDGGQVTFYGWGAATDLIVDVEGYVPRDWSGMNNLVNPVLPASRLCDTRTPSLCQGHGTVGSGVPNALVLQATGNSGVPLTGVQAVILNLTATNGTATSTLTASQAGASPPGNAPSNLNFNAGQTIANRVLVPVNASGQIAIKNLTGSVDVIADVNAWITDSTLINEATGDLFNGVPAVRICDTRTGSGSPCAGQVLAGGGTLSVVVAGIGGIPSMTAPLPADAVAVNVTVTAPGGPGNLIVYPSGTSPGITSDLNFTTNQTVGDLDLVVRLGADGKIVILNQGSTNVQVIVDVVGYYTIDSAI